MFHSRFQCLLATFEQIDPVHSSRAACEPLLRVINFCTLVGLYDNGHRTTVHFTAESFKSHLITVYSQDDLLWCLNRNEAIVLPLQTCYLHKWNSVSFRSLPKVAWISANGGSFYLCGCKSTSVACSCHTWKWSSWREWMYSGVVTHANWRSFTRGG